MWIATKIGFYSIVHKDGAFHLRARTRRDLENLQESHPGPTDGLQIEEWPRADYRYRIRFRDPRRLSNLMQEIAQGVTYPNFKSETMKRPDQRPKHHAYLAFWADLQSLPEATPDQEAQTRFDFLEPSDDGFDEWSEETPNT